MKKSVLFLPILILFLFAGCGGGGHSSSTTTPPNDEMVFGAPEKVTIIGYNGDVMEPFISRDGVYLFFNNAGGPTDKDLFYGVFINETTVQFEGAISAINTNYVDGVPTLDSANTFYYASTADYKPPVTYDTLYKGTWSNHSVTGVTPVTGLATPAFINFDIEVNADGDTLYFAEGDFSGGGGFPVSSDIVIAKNNGNGFIRDPNSATIMANVNTTDLEYASAISIDGLELFFTRAKLSTSEIRIYRTTRDTTDSVFKAPDLVGAIEGFVEGPALSPDEKSLYYHRLNPSSGSFELYRVTRP